MAILFPNDAELALLDQLLGASAANNWQCRLFKDDITPSPSDTASTYSSAEADFSGYGGQELASHGSWPAAASVDGKAESQFSADIPFSRDSTDPGTNNSIYGFFITDSGGALIMAERFGDAPYEMDNFGDTVKVRPTVRLYNP
jgi:hypothetical protein